MYTYTRIHMYEYNVLHILSYSNSNNNSTTYDTCNNNNDNDIIMFDMNNSTISYESYSEYE